MKFGPASIIVGAIIAVVSSGWLIGGFLSWLFSISSGIGDVAILIILTIAVGGCGYYIATLQNGNSKPGMSQIQGPSVTIKDRFGSGNNTDDKASGWIESTTDETDDASDDVSYADQSVTNLSEDEEGPETGTSAASTDGQDYQYDSEY